jgi:hypothetical protein
VCTVCPSVLSILLSRIILPITHENLTLLSGEKYNVVYVNGPELDLEDGVVLVSHDDEVVVPRHDEVLISLRSL